MSRENDGAAELQRAAAMGNHDAAGEQSTGRSLPRTQDPRSWQAAAAVLGFLAALCALAIPFLPVVADTARIEWPNAGDTTAVNAPLTAYWAQHLEATIPCDTIRSVDEQDGSSSLLLSTIPRSRFDTGAGLYLQVRDGELIAYNRGQQVAVQPLPEVGCDVGIDSTATRTVLTVSGRPVYEEHEDVRPRIVGIYSDISADDDPVSGLSVTITPDTRYQSAPTMWKLGVIAIGVIALVGCLIAVNRLDAKSARRAPRWAPIGWWKLTGRDATVIGALGIWVFIGPVTSDDGYILTMARVADDAGYLTNYHRWFGVAEAPFGWFYHLTELMTQVSTVPPWIRLPSFVLGVLSWLLISREILPRLGKEVRNSRAAGWAAASVFLVWWMPFNTGVRPEPVAAVGALLAIAAVERTLVTRRLLPLCLGLLAAALSLAATPTGLIAVAPFIVAARPLFTLLRQHTRTGWAGVLTPIAASGLAVLMVVFADQTFATVLEATRIRNQVGPSLGWFQEFSRYSLLFSHTADGSLARRFPVLLLLLCTATCMVVLLRRGRIPGAALGPSRRMIAIAALFFVLLALTPTKWTHHFGAFAAVGSAMAALTALATSSSVLRSSRNRNTFLAGLLVVAALAATGPNAYWFVSSLGVPWNDTTPSVNGMAMSSLLLIAAAVAALVAFVQNIRAHRPDAPSAPPERRSRALMLSSASLTIVCGLVASFEFTTIAIAIEKQRGSYSLGAANFRHLFGPNCNLSDYVFVERDPVANVLRGLPQELQRTVPPPEPETDDEEDEDDPLPERADDYGMTSAGFHARPTDRDDPLNSPPQGFTSNSVPMWSSYQNPQPTGTLRTRWFDLGESDSTRQLVVSVAVGDTDGISVIAEYAALTDEGFEVVHQSEMPLPSRSTVTWTDSRISMVNVPEEATAVRLNVEDNDLTDEGWIAVSAPRVPSLTQLTERVADNPVYMDWPTSFVYPCVRLPEVRDGISEMPEYRITAGRLASEAGWASSSAGGPIGWLEEVADQPEVPSFLQGDPAQAWGELLQVDPYEKGVPPTVIRGSEVRPGWWSPGPGPAQPDGRTPTR